MSDVQIHPSTLVDPSAEIGAGTIIGPYCVIAPEVMLGENCWLQHHVTLCGPMRAGARNKFYAYCSIGQQTQDLKYQGEPTYLEIGDDNTFREFVTINRSTTGGGNTRVGSRGNFLAYSHIGHDCTVGDGRAHRCAPVLPDWPVRDHGRLHKNCPRRSAVHDRRWQPGGNSRR
jgi:UDP-N-acetylglucosamine acyltransferase